MATMVPNLLSPARVTQALAAVGPPAGSGGLRIPSIDPTGTAGADASGPKATSPRAPRTASPSRLLKTSTAAAANAASPRAAGHPGADAAPAPAEARSRPSPEPSLLLKSSRSGNSRRTIRVNQSMSGKETLGGAGGGGGGGGVGSGRLTLVSEASTLSTASSRFVAAGNVPYAITAMRGIRPGPGASSVLYGRDRTSTNSGLPTPGYRGTSLSSFGGAWGYGGLDSVGGSQMGFGMPGGHGAGPQPGALDLSPLLAIQRILEEYDDDVQEVSVPGRSIGGGGARDGVDLGQLAEESSSSQAESGPTESGQSVSISGLRTIASLRSRGDMHNWQPSTSAIKSTIEDHQRRLRARVDVCQSLKRWTESVLEDARRASVRKREADQTTATAVRFALPDDHGGKHAGEGDGLDLDEDQLDVSELDPDQALDDDEERRLERLRALPPNPRGLGAQLKSHFMAVVEEEVNKKFNEMRTRWEEERGLEAEELRELRELYKDLRKTNIETKDALEKANTRIEIMRMQLKTGASNEKKLREAAAAATAAAAAAPPASAGAAAGFVTPAGEPEAPKSGMRSSRPSGLGDGTDGGSVVGATGRSRTSSARPARLSGTNDFEAWASGGGAAGTGAGGDDDFIHDRLRSIGTRRPMSHTGDMGATPPGDLQAQLRAHADAALSLNRKLQEAEQQIFKLKQDKVNLEAQLTSTKAGGAGGGKYDADVQIFKLKQEKATLEQQLAASHKAAASMAARNSAKSARSAPGRVSGGAGSAKAAAAAAAAEHAAAEIARLEHELASAKLEAATHARTAATRAAELEKAQEDLKSNQTTLNMALQQITAVKEGIAREKERADKAAATAEAAEAAAALAAAATTAASAATTALLKKQLKQQQDGEGGGGGAGEGSGQAAGKEQGPGGEVLVLVERLEKERDAAVAAAGELRQQVRDLTTTVGRREAEAMELRDQIMQLSMQGPPPKQTQAAQQQRPQDRRVSFVNAEGDDDGAGAGAGGGSGAAPAAGSETGAQAPAGPGAAAAAAPVPDAKVMAAALAAMESLGMADRPSPNRRRPSSALFPGAAGVGGDAVGAAAAAAAAAALVPAVMDEIRKLMPYLVQAIEADMGEPPEAAATVAAAAAAAASSNTPAAAAAVSAAAAAAAATARGGGDAAAAASAGAAAAAPTVACALADLLRAEFLADAGGTSSAPPPPQRSQVPADVRQQTSAYGRPPSSRTPVPARSRAAASPAAATRRSQGPAAGQVTPGQLLQLRNQAQVYAADAAAATGAPAPGDAVRQPQDQQQHPHAGLDAHQPQHPAQQQQQQHHHHHHAGPPADEWATEQAAAAAAAAVAEEAFGSPPRGVFVLEDGMTFFPLDVPDAERGRLPQSPAAYYAGLQAQPQNLNAHAVAGHPDGRIYGSVAPPPYGLYLEPGGSGGGGMTAAAAGITPEDLIPQSVSVAAPRPAGLAGSEMRRRRAAFAQLHSSYFTPPPQPTPESDSELPPVANGDAAATAGPMSPAAAAAATAAATAAARARAVRFSFLQHQLDAAAAAAEMQAYVDPNLAAVLQVGRVSPATARAAGAGRSAISPEALGPSLRDRALIAVQHPDPLPPPVPQQQRPQSAAARAIEAARQQLAQVLSTGAGGRMVRSVRPVSAVLPPVGGAMSAVPGGDGGGYYGAGSGGAGVLLASTGAKVRTVTANPQKGIQLHLRHPGARASSARASAAADALRFEYDDQPQPTAAVAGRLSAGPGLTPPLVEVQLHTGSDAATLLAPPAAGEEAPGAQEGDMASELPSSGPELAALARELMKAQGRANKELEEAMSARRELAEEVIVSRQQWLEESRRARDLEKELDSVRMALVTMGVADGPEGSPGSASLGAGTGAGSRSRSRPGTAGAGGRSRPGSASAGASRAAGGRSRPGSPSGGMGGAVGGSVLGEVGGEGVFVP